MSESGESAGLERLPEVGAVHEEDAHHHAVQQEHTGHIEIRWVTHSWSAQQRQAEMQFLSRLNATNRVR